jgi:DNA-binding transcriptional ArsR family regulator
MMKKPARIEITQMRQSAGRAVEMLRALANEDRLLLLCQLAQAEKCVNELETELDIQQPTLSQQLGVLRNQGLVATRREGKFIYYRVKDKVALAILGTLYDLYCSTPKTKGKRAC